MQLLRGCRNPSLSLEGRLSRLPSWQFWVYLSPDFELRRRRTPDRQRVEGRPPAGESHRGGSPVSAMEGPSR
jgi:hypothetical protein